MTAERASGSAGTRLRELLKRHIHAVADQFLRSLKP